MQCSSTKQYGEINCWSYRAKQLPSKYEDLLSNFQNTRKARCSMHISKLNGTTVRQEAETGAFQDDFEKDILGIQSL